MRRRKHTNRSSAGWGNPSGDAGLRRGSAGGFTLFELLVVCGLVALIAGVLARSGAGDIEQARRQRAAADVQGLAQALATFEATVGQWPTLDAGAATNRTRVLLSGSVLPSANPWVGGHSFWAWVRSGFGDLMQNHLLVNAPGGQTAHRYPTQGAARWRGPYLDACPLDPWGRPYVANVLATYSTNRTNHRQLLVVSAGPDGRLQTAATATATQRIAGDDIGCLVWER